MDRPVEVSWVVEEDDESAPQHSRETLTRAYFGAVVTLSLGVLGSTVLPVPFAVSRVGLLTGGLTMLLVAWANDVTSCLLVRAAAYTGRDTYEGLAQWAGGPRWKRITEASLLVLLFGTMCGGISLLSDLGMHIAQLALGQPQAPAGTAAYHSGGIINRILPAAVAGSSDLASLLLSGPAICLSAVLLVLLPMCLLRRIRQLEGAATAGVLIVLALVALLGYDAAVAGFPAVRDGSLPIWSIKVDEHLPEAFTIIGFAFYMQPMMMPLVAEMPAGPAGMAAMRTAVHTSLYAVALAVYGAIGVFGAALFGPETAGNIMVNPIIAGRAAGLALYTAMLVYLALAMTTTHFALRKSLDGVMFGADAPFTWVRHVALTVLILGCSTAVALCFPGAAAQIFNLTGATAVCVVCYIIPVYIHFKVVQHHRGLARARIAAAAGVQQQEDLAPGGEWADGLTEPLLRSPFASPCVQQVRQEVQQQGVAGGGGGGKVLVGGGCYGSGWVQNVAVPVVVLLLGMGCSAAALYVAARDYVRARQQQAV